MTKKLFTLIILSISMLAFVGCGGDNNDDPSQKKDNKTETKDDNKCGNGTIDTGEECDGTNLNGKKCENVDGNTYTGGTLSCSTECKFVKTSCTQGTQGGATCNNNTIEGSEVCDGTALGGKTSCSDVDPKYKEGAGTLTCKNDCTGYDVSQCELKAAGPALTDGGPDCKTPMNFQGQLVGKLDLTGSFTEASGLKAVADAFEVADGWVKDDKDNLVKDFTANPFSVTNAVVVATSGKVGKGMYRAYFQDSEASLLYVGFNVPKADAFKAGQKVSFKVTKLSKFGGKSPQIAQVTDISVVEESTTVFGIDANATKPGKDKQGHIVSFQGTLAATGKGCGRGKVCYNLTTTIGDTPQTYVVRVGDKFNATNETPLAGNACVAYVGPLNYFNDTAQGDAWEFDWLRAVNKQ